MSLSTPCLTHMNSIQFIQIRIQSSLNRKKSVPTTNSLHTPISMRIFLAVQYNIGGQWHCYFKHSLTMQYVNMSWNRLFTL